MTNLQHLRLRRTIFLGILLVASVLPISWTTLTSLNVQPDNSLMPPIWSWPPSLQNYIEVHDMQTYFWQELATSVGISGLVTILTGGVSLLAAYALANASFRGHNLLIHSFLILAGLPAISYAIPLGLSLRQWHLFDTAGGVILAEWAGLTPLAVFILVGFVSQVSHDLEAEARLNGAELHQVLRYVCCQVQLPDWLQPAL